MIELARCELSRERLANGFNILGVDGAVTTKQQTHMANNAVFRRVFIGILTGTRHQESDATALPMQFVTRTENIPARSPWPVLESRVLYPQL